MMRLAATATLLALAGCTGMSTAGGPPALIVNPNEYSRAVLQAAVNKALRTNVVLADDALTKSSKLTIERSLPGSINGNNAQGRNMDPPIQFRLHKDGDYCLLVDQQDASNYILEGVECVAE